MRWLFYDHRFFFCRFLELKIDLVGILLRENEFKRFNFFLSRKGCRGIAQKSIAGSGHNAQDQRIATPQNTMYKIHNTRRIKLCKTENQRKKRKMCVLVLDFCEISAIMRYKKSATHQKQNSQKEFFKKRKKFLTTETIWYIILLENHSEAKTQSQHTAPQHGGRRKPTRAVS